MSDNPIREQEDQASGPTVSWMCAAFLLAGMGTVLLGPILPALAAMWHLQDADSGVLLAAKFTGAFVGGATVPNKLRSGILMGTFASAGGLAGFAFSGGPHIAAAALFVVGFGLGQIIASTNILAGLRFQENTGSAIAAINFFWSLGAVITGLVVATLLPKLGLQSFLFSFAGLFVVVGVGGKLRTVRSGETHQTPQALSHGWRDPALVSFGLLLFFYGGLETSVTQWITTFSVRYHHGAVQSPVVLLWVALTVGRALTSAILRKWSEWAVRLWAMMASVLLLGALAYSTSGWQVMLVAVLLGLSLAPFFPATFALLMQLRPNPRAAGLVLAVSGLGAAALSWAVGAVSTRSGSLRIGMLVPMAAAIVLLWLSSSRTQPAAAVQSSEAL